MNDVQKNRRGRPRRDEGSRNAGRLALIEAAVEILREGGSLAFSAKHVAKRAGTAVGSVYTQFPGLESLRLEANAITMRRLGESLAAALDGCKAGSLEERLLSLADAYLRFAADHHNLWSALFEKRTIEAPPAIADDIAALFAILENVLRDAGVRDDGDIPLMARALWSSVHGMVYLGDIGGLGPLWPSDVPPMIRALIRAAVRGLPLDH